jgi:hypothetical protein
MKYWISPKIKYKTFKLLMEKMPKCSIAIENIDKIIWQMIRDRQINCFIDGSGVNYTLKEIPKKANIISNN